MRNQYHRTVNELTKAELTELKQSYYKRKKGCKLSADELANIDDIVGDAFIKNLYSHLTFVNEDFFCNSENRG